MGKGRPTDYSDELAEAMCNHISMGINVLETCKLVGIARETFYRWLRENEDFNDMYVKSMPARADASIEKIDRIADLLEIGKISAADANVLIQTEKWKSSKYYPKMYGDRKQVDANHSGVVTHSIIDFLDGIDEDD